jgi:hypothetical protein
MSYYDACGVGGQVRKSRSPRHLLEKIWSGRVGFLVQFTFVFLCLREGIALFWHGRRFGEGQHHLPLLLPCVQELLNSVVNKEQRKWDVDKPRRPNR